MSSKDSSEFKYYLDSEKSYDWYYNIKERTMIRLPSGTMVAIYSHAMDERGRIVVVTEHGDYIYADKEVVLPLGIH